MTVLLVTAPANVPPTALEIQTLSRPPRTRHRPHRRFPVPISKVPIPNLIPAIPLAGPRDSPRNTPSSTRRPGTSGRGGLRQLVVSHPLSSTPSRSPPTREIWTLRVLPRRLRPMPIILPATHPYRYRRSRPADASNRLRTQDRAQETCLPTSRTVRLSLTRRHAEGA